MAYEFNGTNQRMSTASAPATNVPLTMACWFNCDDTINNQRLLETRQSNLNYYALTVRGLTAGDPVAIAISQGGTISITNTTAGYSSATWHHACGVFETTTSRAVYLDGANSATNSDSRTPSTPTSFQIGAFLDGATPIQHFDGRMAEIGIWNAALTAAEIASLAKGMTCDKVRPQSLVFYAPLVRDLVDAKGGLTITNNNSATVANHPRVYA